MSWPIVSFAPCNALLVSLTQNIAKAYGQFLSKTFSLILFHFVLYFFFLLSVHSFASSLAEPHSKKVNIFHMCVRACIVDDSHGQLSHISVIIMYYYEWSQNFSSVLFLCFWWYCANTNRKWDFFVYVRLQHREHRTPHTRIQHVHARTQIENDKDDENVRYDSPCVSTRLESCDNSFEFGQFFFIASFIKWKVFFSILTATHKLSVVLLRVRLPARPLLVCTSFS